MSLALSFVATVISLAFAFLVYGHYRARGRPDQLVWSIALLDFGLGTFCQFVAELNGWTPLVYRVWYYTGAMLAAAYLGQGTVYLLAPRRVANGLMVVLGGLSIVGLVLVASSPVDLSQALTSGGVTGNGLPTTLLLLLIPLNTYGTVALVGGALVSVVRFWRQGVAGRRTFGVLLIAVGGLIVALGGTANRLGVPGLLYLTEMLGVSLIFVGYLQTTVRRVAVANPTLPSGADSSHPSSAHP